MGSSATPDGPARLVAPSAAAPVTARRAAGVLLHVTSLPDGRLGRHAHAVVDWLADAGQSWWQVLPVTPPGRDGSPYAGRSAFAGWPGLLARPRARVGRAEAEDFRERHRYWIEPWLRHARGTRAELLADQVRFAREWAELRDHAGARGVRLLGDIPFYVAAGAADVRAHPHLFRTDVRAGVPPDAFSATGQLWGNPVYDWPAMRAEGHVWWVERVRRTLELVDAARIDHFRAFVAWWAVPAGARVASAGSWRRGPGAEVVDAMRASLGPIPLVAEDLGEITPAVRALVERLQLPGMRVLHFAFGAGSSNPHLPARHPPRALAYTGTHDNDTSLGWWRAAPERVRDHARRVLADAGIAEPEPHRALVRLALASPARVAIVPAQDLLGLGSEARLNTPGTRRGNWRWRLRAGQLTPALGAWLAEATAASGRGG